MNADTKVAIARSRSVSSTSETVGSLIQAGYRRRRYVVQPSRCRTLTVRIDEVTSSRDAGSVTDSHGRPEPVADGSAD
jgi:hypothetical protein